MLGLAAKRAQRDWRLSAAALVQADRFMNGGRSAGVLLQVYEGSAGGSRSG